MLIQNKKMVSYAMDSSQVVLCTTLSARVNLKTLKKHYFFKVCRLGVDMMLEDRFCVSRRGGTGGCGWASALGDGL